MFEMEEDRPMWGCAGHARPFGSCKNTELYTHLIR